MSNEKRKKLSSFLGSKVTPKFNADKNLIEFWYGKKIVATVIVDDLFDDYGNRFENDV